MKETKLTLPEIGLIAGTRGMLGAGGALLLGDRLNADTRRAVGWTLFLIGVLSTIPLAVTVFGKSRPAPSEGEPGMRERTVGEPAPSQETPTPSAVG
jgi:hypothetical protein